MSEVENPELYFNRELSLLEFHDRVLSQAFNESVPLLERLRFLCISSTNIDEFFEVRVGGLKERYEAGVNAAGADGLTPFSALERIAERAHQIVDRQYQCLNDILLPKLLEQGIEIVKRRDWSKEQTAWLKDYFNSEVLPLLSPIGLDPAHPFPRILNKSLNFIVQLSGKDAFGRNSGLAIVQCPRALPDVVEVPKDISSRDGQQFVFMSSIIHAFMDELFFGMKVDSCYQFRVTRNSDLFVDEEETGDLRRAIEGELVYRQYGDEVRLELALNCPDDIVDYLSKKFEVTEQDLYRVDGPVNLNRLTQVIDLVNNEHMLYPPFSLNVPKQLKRYRDIFQAISKQDILLHHPYDSFKVVVELIRQAAKDPDVVAIKQTLYRTGPDSVIVDALVAGAKAGKEVTVVIELRARFDEEANVALAEKLQEVGIHVVYGVVGYKTHAKMLLVARREKNKLKHYVHLGTGNYHPKTSKIYTDYGLLTANRAIGEDVYRVFLQLTSLGKVSKLEALYQSPFTLHKSMINLIDREIHNAKDGKPAFILAKMNSLYEKALVDKLYEASAAGVQIDLIVRGVCQIRPGVEGLSENIRVRSIVGRLLEHTRAFCFGNNDNPEVICASADWMSRNMFDRVETGFPIFNKKHRDRIINELRLYMVDNVNAWALNGDGTYSKVEEPDLDPICAQELLLEGDNPIAKQPN